MSEMNIFELATRKRYRYPFHGIITTEDLWALNLEQLDEIYCTLKAEADKEVSTNSLLETRKTEEYDILASKCWIVKYVFDVKQQEAKDREKAVENKEKKERILALIKDKQDEELKNMSAEELTKMLEEL